MAARPPLLLLLARLGGGVGSALVPTPPTTRPAFSRAARGLATEPSPTAGGAPTPTAPPPPAGEAVQSPPRPTTPSSSAAAADALATAGAVATADALWPTSRRQKSGAARVRRALAAVLADPAGAGLRGPDVHTLTVRCGLALGGVRTGPDGRSAHILYDVTPGTEDAAAAALGGPLAGPLRAAVGKALGSRRAPVLKWTPDRLPAETAAVVAELERLGLPSAMK